MYGTVLGRAKAEQQPDGGTATKKVQERGSSEKKGASKTGPNLNTTKMNYN